MQTQALPSATNDMIRAEMMRHPGVPSRTPPPLPPRVAHLLSGRAALLCVLSVALLSACERAKSTVKTDSPAVVVTTPTDSALPAPVARGWNEDVGPVILVSSEDDGAARVLLPEATDSTLGDSAVVARRLEGSRVDLFARTGLVGNGSFSAAGPDDEPSSKRDDKGGHCTSWPAARPVGEGATRGGWTVAFRAGHAVPLPLDSIETLTGADSAQLAATITRLASLLPDDTAKAFRGLPYSVRTARRFSPAPGVTAVVALVVRRVNLEANPREEHVLLVAERDGSKPTPTYETSYHERVAGDEDTLESSDALAAVGIGADRRPTIVLSRDFYDGTTYALLERAAPGRWRISWTSPYVGC